MNLLKYILTIPFAFLILLSELEANSIVFYEEISHTFEDKAVFGKSEQLYSDLIYSKDYRLTVGLSRDTVYIPIIPIIYKLKLDNILSSGVVSAIQNKQTFLSAIGYARKVEYQSLVQAFEKAVDESDAFRQLINSNPSAVDVFFKYSKQKPAASVEEVLELAAITKDLPKKQLDNFIADFSDVAFSAVFKKNPKLVDAWLAVSDLPPVLRTNANFLNATNNLIDFKLFQNIGTASKGEVSNIHWYTVNGNYLNNPMRGHYSESPLSVPDVKLDEFSYQSYLSIKEGLNKLRQTGRLETGIVTRGRTLSQEHYNLLFGAGSPQDIPLKGFQSASRDIEVAKHFTALTDFPGKKVRVLMEIKSKNGVYIDDFSDWGKTLGPINHADAHPSIRVQEEVLMDEGYFRKIGEPAPFIENGKPKVDEDGTIWIKVQLEELGIGFRQISN